MEAIPLVMEPESRLYVDPVIVLDFQSLYPSQIIAYNLCFSTCLGRPTHAAAAGTPLRLGAQTYGLPKGSFTGAVAPDKCASLLLYTELLCFDMSVSLLPKEHHGALNVLNTSSLYICLSVSHSLSRGQGSQEPEVPGQGQAAERHKASFTGLKCNDVRGCLGAG